MKKRQPKKVKGFMVRDPFYGPPARQGNLMFSTLAHLAKDSREYAEDCRGDPWEVLSAEGFKVVPVEIKEVPRAKKKTR